MLFISQPNTAKMEIYIFLKIEVSVASIPESKLCLIYFKEMVAQDIKIAYSYIYVEIWGGGVGSVKPQCYNPGTFLSPNFIFQHITVIYQN